jgi:hypothetical protein
VTTSYSAAQLGDVELVVSGLKDLSIDALDALCATQPRIAGRVDA